MKKESARFYILGLLLAAAVCSVGCSKTSSGNKNGADAQGLSDQDIALQNQNRFGDGGNIPTAQEGGLFKDVHFDFDSSSVKPEYHEELRNDVDILRKDPTLRAEVEGHCDKRGTTEYNMALGQRRAKAVASLMASFGAQSDQLSIVSYGAEVPLDLGSDEAAFAKNRRAHFAIYHKGGQPPSGSKDERRY